MNTFTPNTKHIVFFGTSEFSVYVLEVLKARGIHIDAIVTTPDKPQGRKMILQAPPTKVWAEKNCVAVLQFAKLDTDAIAQLRALSPTLFLVASYGKIIPQAVLDIPIEFAPENAATGASLNVHPSLLPLYRGASPLQSTILADDRDVGVSIILMDKEMDHGPLAGVVRVSEEELNSLGGWPLRLDIYEKLMATEGAELLTNIITSPTPTTLTEQDHSSATFTKKIAKEDGLVEDINKALMEKDYGWKTFLKIQALHGWPGTYFFIKHTHNGTEKDMRIIIKEAGWNTETDRLELTRVLPEGHKEISYADFAHSFLK